MSRGSLVWCHGNPATEVAHRDDPEFDVDDVLDAIEVFRERGYEASSMADIERATGLNTSSIYNTFDRRDAVQSVAGRYETVRLAAIVEVLAAGTGASLTCIERSAPAGRELSEWGTEVVSRSTR